jgi:hypothetical protein
MLARMSVRAPEHYLIVIVGLWLTGEACNQRSQLGRARRQNGLFPALAPVDFLVSDLLAEPFRVQESQVKLALGHANAEKHVTNGFYPKNVDKAHAVDVHKMNFVLRRF